MSRIDFVTGAPEANRYAILDGSSNSVSIFDWQTKDELAPIDQWELWDAEIRGGPLAEARLCRPRR